MKLDVSECIPQLFCFSRMPKPHGPYRRVWGIGSASVVLEVVASRAFHLGSRRGNRYREFKERQP